MKRREEQTPAEAMAGFRAACEPMLSPIRAFAERHPYVALFALPIFLIGMAAIYAVQGHYIESGFLGAVVVYLSARIWRG